MPVAGWGAAALTGEAVFSGEVASTPAGVREAYPHAFSVLRVVDGPPLSDPDSISKLSAAVKAGDILLVRPWWDDPQTTDIKHIYDVTASEPRS